MFGQNKKIIRCLLALVLAVCNWSLLPASASSGLPGSFLDTDIGNVRTVGSATYMPDTGKFTVLGSGSDIWGTEDAFHYVYQPWTGNGQIVARVTSVEKADNWTKAGIMIRENITKQSPYAMLAVSPAYGVVFQDRLQAGADTSQTRGTNAAAPYWVKLMREDGVVSAYDSSDGINWKLIKEQEMTLPETVYFGLAVTSHNNSKLAAAGFEQVNIGRIQPLEKVIVPNVSMSDPTGLYVLDPDSATIPSVTIKLKNKHSYDIEGKIKLSLQARGTQPIWENTVSYGAKINETKQLTIPTTALTQGDYYALKVQIFDQDGTVADQRDFGFGVVHPPHKGVREQSPFGLGLRSEGDVAMGKKIAEKIGVKWQRGINAVNPFIVNPKPGVFWGEAEINKARQEVLDWQQYGISVLGFINYNMAWNVMPGPNGQQLGTYQNRPKDMAAHVEMVYRSIAPLQDLVKNWELWNEPWVHGWTWKTGEAQDYRDMTKMIWDRVKPEYPDVMLIGGGSTSYNRDIVYAKGSQDIGYLDGTTNHGYGVPDPSQLAFLKLQQYMDEHWSKSQAKAGMWNTEVGTAEKYNFPDLPDAEKKYGVARTVAPIYLLNMLSAGEKPIHTFWFSLSYDKGYSGDDFNIYDANTRSPKPAVVSYSAMTHFLEDSTLLEEVYPSERSTWGFLFKRNDGKATAAIYADKDYKGTVTLNGAKGIKAYDYLGKMISDGSQDTLSVTLNPWETNYIVSDLSPEQLKAKLSAAKFDFEKPVIVTPLTFTERVKMAGTKIEVQIENPTANAMNGKLSIQAPEGWELARDFAMVEGLAPGEKRTFAFPASKTVVSDINRYPIRYTFDLYGTGQQIARTMQGQQTIQVAYAPKKTIAVDGDLSDWQDVLPVTMISNGSKDYLEAIMNPNRAKEIIDNPGSFDNVVYKARTAWDDNYYYFEAEVPDENQKSNKPFSQDRYAFAFNADSVQLGFDTMKVNPDDLLYGNPYYDKATTENMDYLFVGTMAQGGIPELHRQMAPGTNKQTYYPTNGDLNPPLGTMDVTEAGGTEGKMKVVRDEANKKTIYEIAVSWNAIPDLKEKIVALAPKQLHEGNFSFAINDAGVNGKGSSFWTKEVGQVQAGSYGFAPFWGSGQKDRGGSLVPRWGFKNEPAFYAYDHTPPVVTVDGVIEGGSYEDQVVPTVKAEDALSGIESIEMTMDGMPWTSGSAVTEKGQHVLVVKAADKASNETSREVHFTVTHGTKLLVTQAAGVYSDSTTLRAILTDLAGLPIGGESVTFSVYGGSLLGTAVTDASGLAELRFIVQQGASVDNDTASVPIQAAYSGSSEKFYRDSTGNNVMTVSKEEASVIYTGTTKALQGTPLTLSAQVIQQPDGEPGSVDGLQVELSVSRIYADGTKVSVTRAVYATDAAGAVNVKAPLAAGLYEISVKLLPNAYYKSTESSSIIAVTSASAYMEAEGFVALDSGTDELGIQAKKVFLEANWQIDAAGVVSGRLKLHAAPKGLDLDMRTVEWFAIAGGEAYLQGVAYTPQGAAYTLRLMLKNGDNADKKEAHETNGQYETKELASIMIWKGSDTKDTPIFQKLGSSFNGNITIQNSINGKDEMNGRNKD